jgi:methyltransferase-like protein/SAM-dependent methyltransferase
VHRLQFGARMPDLPRDGPSREVPVEAARASSASSYDEIPYESQAIADTHPSHLRMIGSLYGVEAVEPAHCRVLELGCARGDNVMAMAASLPGASFLGIDASSRQIADGERCRRAAGLDNVRLLAADFGSLPEDLGEFDYVICHGVYSWVPAPVAELILRLCRRHLAPAGLAFVSYNTYPGWHRKAMLREMMAFHVRALEEPAERIEQARGLVAFLARFAKEDEGTYRAVFEKLALHLSGQEDYYFFHEYLEEHNRPVYFTEFVERATAAGLAYVGSTQFTVWDNNLPAEVSESLATLGDRIVREQYVDFLCARMFRRSLLARQGTAVRDTPDPSAVRRLFIRGRARPERPDPEIASDRPEKFLIGDRVSITTPNPLLKAVLVTLARRAPEHLSFEELEREAIPLIEAGAAGAATQTAEAANSSDRLADAVLKGFLSEVVSLASVRPSFSGRAGDRPRVSAYARVQAAERDRATSLDHRVVQLDDLSRFLLVRCDGSRDRDELARLLAAAILRDEFSLSDGRGTPVRDPDELNKFAREAVESALEEFARSALLVADAPAG